jgi:RNA polymerase sigma factor (sigma-70 family)
MTENGCRTPEAFIGTVFAAFRQSVRDRLRLAGVENRADVEELSQSVFSIALRRHRLVPRELEAAGHWVLAVAVKIAANHQRLFRHRCEVQDNAAMDRAIAEPIDPEAALMRRILVHESARALDTTQREILEHYYIEGDSLETLATMLGLSKSGAHVRLGQAAARLKAMIAEQR